MTLACVGLWLLDLGLGVTLEVAFENFVDLENATPPGQVLVVAPGPAYLAADLLVEQILMAFFWSREGNQPSLLCCITVLVGESMTYDRIGSDTRLGHNKIKLYSG